MNSNLVHNLLNAAVVIVAGGTAALMASGCVTATTGALDCSASWVSPQWAAAIVGVIGVVKIAINVMRDGVKGLGKRQPPVE